MEGRGRGGGRGGRGWGYSHHQNGNWNQNQNHHQGGHSSWRGGNNATTMMNGNWRNGGGGESPQASQSYGPYRGRGGPPRGGGRGNSNNRGGWREEEDRPRGPSPYENMEIVPGANSLDHMRFVARFVEYLRGIQLTTDPYEAFFRKMCGINKITKNFHTALVEHLSKASEEMPTYIVEGMIPTLKMLLNFANARLWMNQGTTDGMDRILNDVVTNACHIIGTLMTPKNKLTTPVPLPNIDFFEYEVQLLEWVKEERDPDKLDSDSGITLLKFLIMEIPRLFDPDEAAETNLVNFWPAGSAKVLQVLLYGLKSNLRFLLKVIKTDSVNNRFEVQLTEKDGIPFIDVIADVAVRVLNTAFLTGKSCRGIFDGGRDPHVSAYEVSPTMLAASEMLGFCIMILNTCTTEFLQGQMENLLDKIRDFVLEKLFPTDMTLGNVPLISLVPILALIKCNLMPANSFRMEMFPEPMEGWFNLVMRRFNRRNEGGAVLGRIQYRRMQTFIALPFHLVQATRLPATGGIFHGFLVGHPILIQGVPGFIKYAYDHYPGEFTKFIHPLLEMAMSLLDIMNTGNLAAAKICAAIKTTFDPANDASEIHSTSHKTAFHAIFVALRYAVMDLERWCSSNVEEEADHINEMNLKEILETLCIISEPFHSFRFRRNDPFQAGVIVAYMDVLAEIGNNIVSALMVQVGAAGATTTLSRLITTILSFGYTGNQGFPASVASQAGRAVGKILSSPMVVRIPDLVELAGTEGFNRYLRPGSATLLVPLQIRVTYAWAFSSFVQAVHSNYCQEVPVTPPTNELLKSMLTFCNLVLDGLLHFRPSQRYSGYRAVGHLIFVLHPDGNERDLIMQRGLELLVKMMQQADFDTDYKNRWNAAYAFGCFIENEELLDWIVQVGRLEIVTMVIQTLCEWSNRSQNYKVRIQCLNSLEKISSRLVVGDLFEHVVRSVYRAVSVYPSTEDDTTLEDFKRRMNRQAIMTIAKLWTLLQPGDLEMLENIYGSVGDTHDRIAEQCGQALTPNEKQRIDEAMDRLIAIIRSRIGAEGDLAMQRAMGVGWRAFHRIPTLDQMPESGDEEEQANSENDEQIEESEDQQSEDDQIENSNESQELEEGEQAVGIENNANEEDNNENSAN